MLLVNNIYYLYILVVCWGVYGRVLSWVMIVIIVNIWVKEGNWDLGVWIINNILILVLEGLVVFNIYFKWLKWDKLLK